MTFSFDSLLTARAAAVAGAVVVAGVAAGVAVHRLRRPNIPTDHEWREVGKLVQLELYPLKSGRARPATTLFASEAGLQDGPLRDRLFMGVDRNGTAITGRSHPQLLLIEVTLIPKPGCPGKELVEFRSSKVDESLVLDFDSFEGAPKRKAGLWATKISGVDCGDKAAAWLRKAVVTPNHGEATPQADIRLLYYPSERSDRAPAKPGHPAILPGDRGLYTDEGTYHILTTSSLDVLNEKLKSPLTYRSFRPTFLVEGPKPFEDDNWTYVRIGDRAIFKVLFPCGRCQMTTLDPVTATKSPDSEPLMTLRKFRKPNKEQERLMGKNYPMLGMILGICRFGDVSVGDRVYVTYKK